MSLVDVFSDFKVRRSGFDKPRRGGCFHPYFHFINVINPDTREFSSSSGSETGRRLIIGFFRPVCSGFHKVSGVFYCSTISAHTALISHLIVTSSVQCLILSFTSTTEKTNKR